MNEITIHGNLTANPVVNTNPNTGRSATTFDVALNSRYFDRTSDQWRDRPAVFHKVVCFGDLAANAAETLRKGMTVTVTGTFADDTYTPNGADKPIRRTRLEAADVAVSLRWAVAAVARKTTTGDQRPEPTPQPAATATTSEPAEETAAPAEATTPAKPRRTTRRTEAEPVAAA